MVISFRSQIAKRILTSAQGHPPHEQVKPNLQQLPYLTRVNNLHKEHPHKAQNRNLRESPRKLTQHKHDPLKK